MLGNKLNCILNVFLVVLVTLPSLESKVYWFTYYPILHSPKYVSALYRPANKNHEKQTPTSRDIINVIKLINSRQQRQKDHTDTVENNCARLFGSIYGTKQQRLMCLKNLKRKMVTEKLSVKHKDSYQKKPFIDLTRAVYDSDQTRSQTLRTPEFSTDYIDISDLRTIRIENLDENFRKANPQINYQRTLYSSESDSDSVEVKKTSEKYYKKPKRFQIIDNDQSDKGDFDETEDSFEDKPVKTMKKDLSRMKKHNLQYSDTDVEYKKPIKKYKKKEHYIQGSDDFSEDESEQPVSSKSNKKEYYLQGKRLVSSADGRRRLPHFMPKRFHWDEEELPNLGYYWFNGPQGRYPNYRLRP